MIDYERLQRSSNGIARVQCEIEVHSKLNHDGIVQLIDSFIVYSDDAQQQQQTPKTYVLVLEFYGNGITLSQYLKQHKGGKLSECHAYTIFAQLVDVVTYLHHNHVIHRDLKLQNILIAADDALQRIKLIDFGLATSTSITPDRYTMCGTPNYCAPEIAKHEKHGYLVDVWSLGIILYTLLTGAPPFHTGDTKKTLLKIITHKTIHYPTYLSDAVCELLRGLLHKTPSERLSTSDIVHAMWMTRKGVPLPTINIKHLPSIKKVINKSRICIEIQSTTSTQNVCSIEWKEPQFGRLQILCATDDGDESQANISCLGHPHHHHGRSQKYNICSLPVRYYKVYELLASFVDIISARTPMIALLVKRNRYALQTIVLLHNKDVDFIFGDDDRRVIHYCAKQNSFETEIQSENECHDKQQAPQTIKLCQSLIGYLDVLCQQLEMFPIEMKFDIHHQVAIHRCDTNKWRYFLWNGLICTRTKSDALQTFSFADADIEIVIEGKCAPYLIEKGGKENKVAITSKHAQIYAEHLKCITTVLQL
eukprot:CAMPEP_0202700254 /NCGR_PEP_ID=MMETSP1385-20130828/13445_1 /ASSEMBLY_ACC=CAM_ASM_000861 /TAXON_ID=933848 /ORGANISM="Elphidium margaritaceum" /LENGTH=534 /DNA_ID=CAMNT_0049357391 /DNA_START=125 /DNA_END=1729 /DNA_ORIENTATION=+